MKSAPIVVFATLGLVLISGTLLAGPKQKTNAGKKTYTGTVTDTVCGTKHMMKDMDDAQCARMCVEHGADYALAIGSKIYNLKGNKENIGKLAGQKAKITGTITGDTITVESIEAAGAHK